MIILLLSDCVIRCEVVGWMTIASLSNYLVVKVHVSDDYVSLYLMVVLLFL